ncbi:MAG: peptidyl-prolyl cis-trans isomerase [bacterium]
MMRNLSFWGVAAVFLAAGLVAGAFFGKSGALAANNTVILSQGGHDYTLEDYSLFLFIQSSSMFEKFVEDVIVRAEAEKRNITVSDQEIEDFIKENMIDADGRNRYVQYQEVFAQDVIRRQITMQILEEKLVKLLRENIIKEQKITVTEAEAKDYFLKNIDKFHKPERVEVSLLSTKSREKCEEAIKKLKDGADFNDLVAEMGEIPELKQQGGYLGVMSFRDLDSINSVLADTAFNKTKEGGYSEIIRGENHFHIVFVHKKYPAQNPTFEDVKNDLMAQMLEAKLAKPMSAAYNAIIERGFETVSPKVKLLEPKKPENVEVPSSSE